MAEDAYELQVGSKYESWDLAKRAIEDFQWKTCSQFYVRDSRTLAQAKKTTPRIVEMLSWKQVRKLGIELNRTCSY